jgi:hypothetical protein
MKKELMILLILFTLIISACAPSEENSQDNLLTTSDKIYQEYDTSLSDFQIHACKSARDNNACPKLEDLGLVTIEECCQELNMCC